MHILYINRALWSKSTNFAKKLLRVFLQVVESSNLPNFDLHIFKLKIMTDLWLISSIIMNYAEKNWILNWNIERWINTFFLSHKDYPFILLERKIGFNHLKGYIPGRQPRSIIYSIGQQIFEKKYSQKLHFLKKNMENMVIIPWSWHESWRPCQETWPSCRHHGKIIAWQPIISNPGRTLFQFSVQLMSGNRKIRSETTFFGKSAHQKPPTSYLNVVWYMMQTLVCNKNFFRLKKNFASCRAIFLEKITFQGKLCTISKL